MTESKPAQRSALLVGTTGLIGRALLRLLLHSERYALIVAFVRRTTEGIAADPKLRLQRVDFAHLPEPFPAVQDVYIALGTTIKAAGSEAAFRQVDFEHVVATARAARAAGATRLMVVSALGADTASRIFYNRVKGEMQAAIVQLGYESVVIAQPSLLIGDRAALGQPVRAGEVWAARLLAPAMALIPRRIRPIRADAVAAALLAAGLAAKPGVSFLSSAEMQAHARH